jgi:hypothetical protein
MVLRQAARQAGELVAARTASRAGKPQLTSCRQSRSKSPMACRRATTASRSALPAGVRAHWMFQVISLSMAVLSKVVRLSMRRMRKLIQLRRARVRGLR